LPSLCWHVTAINPPSRTPAGGLNLEYGVSAVFPCGDTPAPVRNGGTPHTSDYRSRKFVFRSVAHSQFLSNVDLSGVPGVWIVGPLRPHGRRRTRRTPSWFASGDARLRRQPGERVASAARWKRRQHSRRSNSMRVGDRGEAKSRHHVAFGRCSQRARFHQPADAGPFAGLCWGRSPCGPFSGGGGPTSCRHCVGT